MIPHRSLLVSVTTLGFACAVPSAAADLAGYGFRSGAASTSIRGEYSGSVDAGTRIGFAGALFGRFSMGRLLSVQPEFGWTSKGDVGDLTISAGSESFSAHVETRLDYLEIPVLLRLDIAPGSSFEPYVLAGPGVAFRTGSAREVGEVTIVSPAVNARIQRANIFEGVGTFNNPRFRDVDWSAIAGGGLAMGRGPLRFVLDSRYALGLVGIYPDGERSWAHNGAWITTLGIELR